MARYLGSKHRLCRRVGEKLCDSAKCPVVRRNYPPGVHGPQGKGRMTPFGMELQEKQKAKRTYGLLERQFRSYYDHAVRRVGDTSLFLGQMFETRLDNVVYRLGFAKTRSQARQLVTHGHITVNQKKVTIPSFGVRIGNAIGLKQASEKREGLRTATRREDANVPAWLSLDGEKKSGMVVAKPDAKAFPQNLNFKVIIEHYSR